ncbi:engXCA [Symbiodinium sp. CCMP2592]|nr:engXCA [Symbiodinium sp. CCMP2592]
MCGSFQPQCQPSRQPEVDRTATGATPPRSPTPPRSLPPGLPEDDAKNSDSVVTLAGSFGADFLQDLFRTVRQGNLEELTAHLGKVNTVALSLLSSAGLGFVHPDRAGLAASERVEKAAELTAEYLSKAREAASPKSTLLLAASEKGRYLVVESLLQHKADPLVADDKGNIPLHKAAQSGSLLSALLLLDRIQSNDRSANIASMVNGDGETPEILADLDYDGCENRPFVACTGAAKSDKEDWVAQFPLSTKGRAIVNQHGERFRLRSVNWYGDQNHVVGGLNVQSLETICGTVQSLGFTAVRLPFSNEMLRSSVASGCIDFDKNPKLQGLTALEVLDEVVHCYWTGLATVCVNNHTTHGEWCGGPDRNGLWFDPTSSFYTEAQWLEDWAMLASRYRDCGYVVGFDLRNEVRFCPWPFRYPIWLGGGILRKLLGCLGFCDWADAARRCAQRPRRMCGMDSDLSLMSVPAASLINAAAGDLPRQIVGRGAPDLANEGAAGLRRLGMKRAEQTRSYTCCEHHKYWTHVSCRSSGIDWFLEYTTTAGTVLAATYLLRTLFSDVVDVASSGSSRSLLRFLRIFSHQNYGEMSAGELSDVLFEQWGWLLEGDICPVWISEFGTGPAPGFDLDWFKRFVEILGRMEVDYAYWPLNVGLLAVPAGVVLRLHGLLPAVGSEEKKSADSQLEDAGAGSEGSQDISALKGIYGWALAHACWLRNRYTPVHGTTPYEAVTDSAYSGTICRFGEKVLGYLKPDGKSSARWRHGLFGFGGCGRFEDNFDPDFAASFDVSVFEHGLSSIGGKLVLGHKKPAAPVAMPIPAYVGPPPSPPAAAESPLPHEARGSPSQIAGTDSPVRSPTSINYSPSDGMSATEDAALSDRHGDVLSTDAGEPSSAEAGMPAIPAEAGAVASSAPLISEALGLSENPRPAKVARRSDDDQVMALEGQISLITAPGCCADEMPAGDLLVTSGEDENVTLTFDGDTLDELEDYDQSFLEDQSGDTELLPELCRPCTSDIEPELSPEELEALDVIADGVEIARLEGMTVLLPESAAHNDEYAGQEATHLTTRMVRTWREKELGGSPVWYRRSRYVAREYAWLNERHDLFSPASTALSNRLLPIHYLCHEPDPDDPWVMVALDIRDAYLSVKQTRLVIVQHAGVRYVLGRVLPGQRDGSKEWYLAFSSFLDEALGFKKCDALPSLIREPASKFSMQMHVDDLLGAGSKRFLLERLRPTLESKYRVSIRILEAPGDTISFLKRHHTLLAGGKMLLTPSAKHFEKLFSVMKIDERSAPKKTPHAPQLDEVDNSELLACADAKAFRCAIGILLYLAVDLIECQGAIRALSSYMISPTRNAQAALRHLLKYLLEGQHHGLLLDRRNCYNGVSGEIPRTSQPVLCLEAFSDANWAVAFLYSSSRTQRVIALSSGESELLAATSTLCDALFVRQLLAFIADDEPPQIHHFLDASAAKGIMERSGVGRVRHLSVRVLWTQQLVADKIIMLRKVATSINVADLNTKGLSRSRMLMLLHIIGCWHTVHECFVGEDEIADLRYKQAMKDAVRAVRSTSSASVSKPMIQAIVIAVVSALSRAADDADGDNGLDDSGADLPDWANRVLVWFLGLWVRDDTGVSVIDMLVQPHALVLACVTMLMLVLCIRTLCCRVSDRGQVNVQIAGPRDHVSFQFDRQLNLHVGVGAPGTPTNPLSFDFDGDDSPPHVLSALRKGARPKASTRPGPRYEDEDAPHPDASSSAAPPTGAMNAVQAHVPPADHASAPGTPAESMSSQLSTQSFRELHGYPIAVARRMNHRGSLVWVSHTGRCYHRLRCFKLDGCDRVKAYERHEAQNRGLRACKKCNP